MSAKQLDIRRSEGRTTFGEGNYVVEMKIICVPARRALSTVDTLLKKEFDIHRSAGTTA